MIYGQLSSEIDLGDTAPGSHTFIGRVIHMLRLIGSGDRSLGFRIIDHDVCIAARGDYAQP